jgi:Na+-transporting NADH:ubiquinone oxidoreductase subunit C
MDTNKNLYTIVYSVVLVVVVAAVLAFAAEALKPKQQRNIEIETKQMILKSVRLAPDALTAPDKAKYIEDQYSKYIKDSSITTEQGDKKLYVCTFENGEKAYIVYVSGVGLWGPIWGYVAFKNDFNTIYGTTFDHKGETPETYTIYAFSPFSKVQTYSFLSPCSVVIEESLIYLEY